MLKAVILAGGLGTRLREETEYKPKPMVEIGGKPILWHIMKNLNAQGIKEFIICLGYKKELIIDYFTNYQSRNTTSHITMYSDGRVSIEYETVSEDWKITLVDTGLNSQTGGRLKRIEQYLEGEEDFFCTYGDGLANVDIKDLIKFHISHEKIATVTAVKPTNRFGTLLIDEKNNVLDFVEKPVHENFVSGGFFVFKREILNMIDSDDAILEKETLPKLVSTQQLNAYKHEGWWKAMDTYRESLELNEIWDSGDPSWMNWK